MMMVWFGLLSINRILEYSVRSLFLLLQRADMTMRTVGLILQADVSH